MVVVQRPVQSLAHMTLDYYLTKYVLPVEAETPSPMIFNNNSRTLDSVAPASTNTLLYP